MTDLTDVTGLTEDDLEAMRTRAEARRRERAVDPCAADCADDVSRLLEGLALLHDANEWMRWFLGRRTLDGQRTELEVYEETCDEQARPVGDGTYSGLAVSVLAAHQRRDVGSCLCGWSELGKSHTQHVAGVLDAAGALRRQPG